MKKLLVGLVALITVGSAFAGYKIEMKNATNDVMKVEIGYIGENNFFCRPDSITLQAGEYKSLDAGLCCVKGVKITALSGLEWQKDLPYYYAHPGVKEEFVNPCRGFSFTMKKNEFGQLIIEAGASQ